MTHNISYSDNWEFADWKRFQKGLFRLQRRIFKAQSRMAQSVARRGVIRSYEILIIGGM